MIMHTFRSVNFASLLLAIFCAWTAASRLNALHPAQTSVQQAPRYSLGIPSVDEVPLDAIPPAPAPTRRAPAAPPPQAKSPEESVAYENFLKEQRPDERIRLVEDFLLQYP